MDTKPQVYVCTGCGIGDSIDIGALSASAQESGVTVVVHPFLCSAEGVALIDQRAPEEGVRRVVVAACSPRAKTDAFTLKPALVERVNLREQVAWSHAPREEETQSLAEDLLRMGIVKIGKTEPPEDPSGDGPARRVMVVGGGVSGMTAALGAAEAGCDVVLVEEADELGGWLTKFRQVSPGSAPYRDPRPSPVAGKVAAVQANSLINVMTSTKVEKVDGQPGEFKVVVQQGSSPAELNVGSIVMATGWEPYDAANLGHLGFGKSPNVVTSVALEEMAKGKGLGRPSDGGPLRNVVFVQCAGSRDENHLPYCSSVCCQVSLKQALYVREAYPDANVYILHKDIRTPGHYEDFYKRVQEEGVLFLRSEVTGVANGPDGTLTVQAQNTPLGEAIELEADLVVLAVGMQPRASGALNLQYRQGPDLPVSALGFPDSNFVCWPYETQRTGIYTAGCVREPMNVGACEEDATGAALRAVQSLELIGQGQALHPRVGDPYFPSFFLQRCTQCKRCTEECPFGALDEDERGTPGLNVNRCRRCGVCMGACPERLVSFKNYSVDQLASAIKAISVPEEEEKIRVLALVCENDAYPALDMACSRRSMIDPSIRVLPVRCLGSANIVFIADAMARGIDGVVLLGCRFGDDYQCHFIKGSELANRRMENVKETLGRLRLEPERVRLLQVAIDEYDKLPQMLNDFVDELRLMGPNPYKGF